MNIDDFLKSGTRKIQGTRKLGEYSSDTGSSSSFSHHYSMLTYHLYLCADHCVMICSFSLHLHFVHPRVFVDIHSYFFHLTNLITNLGFTVLFLNRPYALTKKHYFSPNTIFVVESKLSKSLAGDDKLLARSSFPTKYSLRHQNYPPL